MYFDEISYEMVKMSVFFHLTLLFKKFYFLNDNLEGAICVFHKRDQENVDGDESCGQQRHAEGNH